MSNDIFELYDLRVEVVCPQGERILCGAKNGDYFLLQGEMLHLPPDQGFSIYSLSSVLPLLAAKQRVTHPNDWMTTDTDIACPDPNCKSRLRIVRTSKRKFSHAEVTAVPLPDNDLATPAKGSLPKLVKLASGAEASSPYAPSLNQSLFHPNQGPTYGHSPTAGTAPLGHRTH